jgi:benzoylsuccinyl-CoA thiolase BbsB subunit
MRDVAVIGVDMTPFGRHEDKSIEELAAAPVMGALKDAGTQWKAVEAAYVGHEYQGLAAGQRILAGVGATGIPITNIENACSAGATAFREAYLMIALGMYDIVLALGCEKMDRGLIQQLPDDTWRTLGTDLIPSQFALVARWHMDKYGTTTEQFAKVAVKAHRNGVLNPYAQYRKEETVEEVLGSRMISDPITLLMCCPTGDGAAAAVLCSMEKAGQFTTKPIKVAASALNSMTYAEGIGTQNFGSSIPSAQSIITVSAREAYEQAGLGPEDLDVVELHDAFATSELIHYEELELCKAGEGGRLIDEGAVDLGGRIPVNPSGGLLAKGHPLGATGVAQIVEIVWQLRGVCGDRQVEGAKVGLAEVAGTAGVNATHILTK